jgi:hypothetical protein
MLKVIRSLVIGGMVLILRCYYFKICVRQFLPVNYFGIVALLWKAGIITGNIAIVNK